jgi:lysozyme
VWTIGVGHTTAAGPPAVNQGLTITAAESDSILADDLKATEGQVSGDITVQVAQHEFDALVSLCFNIGPGNFKKSSVVRDLNAGNRQAAGDAFLMWNKAGGNVITGLSNRRNRERTLFLTGHTGKLAGLRWLPAPFL